LSKHKNIYFTTETASVCYIKPIFILNFFWINCLYIFKVFKRAQTGRDKTRFLVAIVPPCGDVMYGNPDSCSPSRLLFHHLELFTWIIFTPWYIWSKFSEQGKIRTQTAELIAVEIIFFFF
jgi:hypothetical protein